MLLFSPKKKPYNFSSELNKEKHNKNILNKNRRKQIKFFPCLILLFVRCVSSTYWQMPKLGLPFSNYEKSELHVSPDYETQFYTQILDHFSYRPESYATFQQRYIINYRYWGGMTTNSPIFVYMGAEDGIEYAPSAIGFMSDNAPHFRALLLYIEHRYYGVSLPFKEESFRNSSTLGYLSSSQALADAAELIIDVKKKLSADTCPVIVIGGSYGGMLASWFRLKYPHIALGALASSAPILYFDDITPQDGYHAVVTKDFREASESCYNTIRQSWSEIDEVATQPDGLSALSEKFNTCLPLKSPEELKYSLGIIYVTLAQYDGPPHYPVNKICDAIDGLPKGFDTLSRIATGFTAGLKLIIPDVPCNSMFLKPSNESGWYWQTCTELVMPIGYHANETMFQNNPFDLNELSKDCQESFGVTPRPHWVATEFGGHNISFVLKKFASNIIFSNGLRDPYSAGGVLQNISNNVVAIYTREGAHTLDLLPANSSDPEWLLSQRKKEIHLLEGWIEEYNARLPS